MAEIQDDIAPKNGRYPQINLNTGVSLASVVMLIGMVAWSVGIKSDVGYHEQRLAIVEAGMRDLRTMVDTARITQGQSETKLEGRLTRIEILLQDVLNRMQSDRRQDRQNP